MRLKAGAFSRYRPRFLTLVVLIVVAVPIVIANLSHDEMTPQVPPSNPSYGWPLVWYECRFTSGSTSPGEQHMDIDLVQWSGPWLAVNLALWLAIFVMGWVVCEWLLRRYPLALRYRPRLVTLIVLLIIAAPIVLANLSQDDWHLPGLQPNRSYGWPLVWYEYEFKLSPPPPAATPHIDLNFARWSGPRLAGNLAMWFIVLAVTGAACKWLRRLDWPALRYRPRLVTLIALMIVAVPIVLANLNFDERKRFLHLQQYPSYGWPSMWRWRDKYVFFGGAFVLDENYSAARLSYNLTIWLLMLVAAGAACEWLLRHYRPRLQWSLKTMLAAVGLVAMLFAWCKALRDRANLQDRIVSTSEHHASYGFRLYMDRWGPKWLDLVGADRFRRCVVGADVNGYDGDDDEEFLNRLGQLRGLQYLNLSVRRPTPGMAVALAEMRQLRILRIDNSFYRDNRGISQECLAAIGKLAQLEELHLGGTIEGGSLKYLAELTNLKSLSLLDWRLQIDWDADEEQESDEPEMDEQEPGVPDTDEREPDGPEMDEQESNGTAMDEQESDGSEMDEQESALLNKYGGTSVLAKMPVLPRLESIDLRSSYGRKTVGDRDLRRLVVLPRLRTLNLSDVDINDAGLAELASLQSLEELAIGGNLATPARLQALLALKRLKALHILRYVAVTDAGLADLSSLEYFEKQELTGGEAIPYAAGQLLFALKNLKELHTEQYGFYDNSNRMTTVALDHGDRIFALESEVEGLGRAFDALRQSNPGIVIDSDPKWFDERRGQKRPDYPRYWP